MSDLEAMLAADPDEPLSRAAKVVDFREAEGIVEAKLAAYEIEAEIFEDLTEVFSRGAFAGAVKSPWRVKVSDQQHNRRVVIGQAVELREEDDGLYGLLKIADTSAGRDTLTLLRDGVLDELSVEFVPQKRHMKVTRRNEDEGGGMHIRHNRATLIGVSPVSQGAYGQAAKVLAVRAERALNESEREAREEAERRAAEIAEIREAELQNLRGLTA